VVNVGFKPLYGFGDTSVPCAVIDGGIQIIHARRVWFSFRLLSEDWCIQKDISDVVELMILDLDLVWISKDGHNHRLSNLVNWILNATAARNDP
jgi:hypothetical protein